MFHLSAAAAPGAGFRFDINALRALAVIAVLLFHFDHDLFSGGFVGVDIFFVISGYLMTAIILKGLAQGNFSPLRFYKIRARRIVPALTVVCGICLLFGFCNFGMIKFELLSRHVRDSLLFVSNFTYLRESTDYFGADAFSKILLHSWSLSVEWQFYLLYPLLLIAYTKIFKNKSPLYLIAVLFVASLGFSVYYAHANANLAYYMLHTRAFELLMGAFAFSYKMKADQNDKLSPGFEILGYILLCGSIVFFDGNLTWPGYFALIPTCGTFLVLAAQRDRRVYRFAPIQFLGKISYSLYLVHWPILTLFNVYGVKLPAWAFISLSLGAASLLYVTVERRRDYAYKCFAAYLLCLGLAICAKENLFMFRYPEDLRFTKREIHNQFYGGEELSLKYADKSKFSDSILLDNVVVFGDSFMRQYAPLLDAYGVKTVRVLNNGCYSSADFYTAAEKRSSCDLRFNELLTAVKDPKVKYIIHAQSWTAAGHGVIERKSGNKIDRISDAMIIEQEQKLLATLRHDQKLILIGVPEVPGFMLFDCQSANHSMFGFLKQDCPVTKPRMAANINRELKNWAEEKPNVLFLNPKDILCKDDVCLLQEKDHPLFQDSYHLSVFGAEMVVPHIVKLLQEQSRLN